MGGGASKKRTHLTACHLKIPDRSQSLTTDGEEVIFERRNFDYCKNTFFTSNPIRLKENENFEITVEDGAVLRIGLVDERPRQDDFVQSAIFETEDGFGCGTSHRCLYLNHIGYLQYGAQDEPREYLPLNHDVPVWMYIIVLYGSPKISARYEGAPVQWTAFDDTNIGLTQTEAVCGLVTDSDKCIVREPLNPGHTYLLHWNMRLEEAKVAERRPKYGFIRVGLVDKEPKNLESLSMNKESMDDSVIWCSDSAIRSYPYSGTLALSINKEQGSITHNVLVSSVGASTTRKQISPQDLSGGNLRLVVELSCGLLRVEHGTKVAVEQSFGSIVYVKNYREFQTEGDLYYHIASLGHTPCKILYGPDPTSFVVEFDDKVPPKDMDIIRQKLTKDIKVLNETCSIQIIGVQEDMTKFELEMFFSKQASCGGGAIILLKQLGTDNGIWIIQYQSAEVARRVYMTDEYSIEGKVVKVLPYYTELGFATNRGEKPAYDRQPLQVCLDMFDEEKVSFVRERPNEVEKLKNHLKHKANVSLVWKETEETDFETDDDDDDEDDIMQLECNLTNKDYEMLPRWKENAKSTLTIFFDDEVNAAVVQVEQNRWDNSLSVVAKLKKIHDFDVHADDERHTLKLIASNQTDISKVSMEIGKVVPTVEKTSTSLTGELAEKYLVLEGKNKVHDLGKLYTGTGFNVDKRNIEVTFTGPREEVGKLKAEVLRRLLQVRAISITINKDQEKVCQKAVKELTQALKEGGLAERFKISRRSISIYMHCDTDDVVKTNQDQLQRRFNEVIKDREVTLQPKDMNALSRTMWKSFSENIEERFAACITMHNHNNAIRICALNTHLDKICSEVRQFLDSQAVQTDILVVTHDIAQYIEEHGVPGMQRDAFSIDYRGEECTGKVLIKGDKSTKEATKHCILDEIKDIKTFWFHLSQPWLASVIEDMAINRFAAQKHSVISVDIGDTLAENGIPALSVLKTRGVAVQVKQGSITQMAVDAIVSAADPEMKMESRIAKAIIKTGGRDIQRECSEYVREHGAVQEGEAFLTTAGILPCCSVIHAVGPTWKGGGNNEETLLKTTIRKVLQIADDKSYSSIAIPVMSYGTEKYPLDKACEHIMKAVKEYIEKGSKLSTVYVVDLSKPVVDRLTEALGKLLKQGDWTFFKHEKTLALANPDSESAQEDYGSRPRSSRGLRQGYRWEADDFSTTRARRMQTLTEKDEESDDDDDQQPNTFAGGMPYNIDITHKLRLNIVKGAIDKQKVDVIVCPTFHFPELSGAIANAVKAAAGQQFVQECNELATLDFGQVKRTSGGGMNCKHVYHTKLETSWSANSWRHIYGVVKRSLEVASQYKQTSIAFPTFGTGMSKYPADKVADAIIKSVLKFASKHPGTSLTDVFIVVYYGDVTTIGIVEVSVPPMFTVQFGNGSKQQKDPGINRKRSSPRMKRRKYKRRNTPPEHSETDDFVVFKAISKSPGKDILKAMEMLVNQEFITKELALEFEEKEDHLSRDETKLLESTAEKYDIKVVVESQNQKPVLKLSGVRSKITKAEPTFMDIVIRTFPDIRLKKKMAEGVLKQYQWFYDNHGKLEKVSVECNLDIYMGYIKGKNFCYKNGATEYRVIVKDLEEHPVDQPRKRRRLYLKNHVNTDIKVPDSWTISVRGGKFVEVELDLNDNEFTDVKRKFIQGNCKASKFERIVRIENKYLWLQYQSKKLQLERQNPRHIQNERDLWHGTDVDTAKLIAEKGYDRSFVGKNAAFFGQGVYFAVESSYSGRDIYAKPDINGVRRMFLNKVLTGEYTKVDENAGVLPPKKESNTECILYDSAVNDINNIAMFIIFHDTQAYPQYLVEYRS